MSDGDRALQDPVAGSTNSGAGLPPRGIQNSTLTVERIAGRRSSASIQEETVNDIPSSARGAKRSPALRQGGRKSSVSFDEDAAEAAALASGVADAKSGPASRRGGRKSSISFDDDAAQAIRASSGPVSRRGGRKSSVSFDEDAAEGLLASGPEDAKVPSRRGSRGSGGRFSSVSFDEDLADDLILAYRRSSIGTPPRRGRLSSVSIDETVEWPKSDPTASELKAPLLRPRPKSSKGSIGSMTATAGKRSVGSGTGAKRSVGSAAGRGGSVDTLPSWRTPEAPLTAKMVGYEALDYTLSESELQRADYADKKHEELEAEQSHEARKRWGVTFAIGFLTALIAAAMTYCTKQLREIKVHIAEQLVRGEERGSFANGTALVAVVAICAGFVAIAASATFIQPESGGSGIPEVKTLLNGILVRRSMRIKTLVCKASGIVFAVAGGLPVGKEGPMIHSGAVVGSGLSQGKSTFLGFDTSWSKIKQFRNDKEKRDFIACGAAAGVAAAFGAPLGGVMFCLEEGASWWHPDLTWRTLFCAMTAAFLADLFLSGIKTHDWGRLNTPGLLTFGFSEFGEGPVLDYAAWEVPGFIAMGLFGGLLGAGVNACNKMTTQWRMRNITSRHVKHLEAIFIAVIAALVSFGLPCLFGAKFCRPVESPPGCPDRSHIDETTVSLFCPEGEYNELATLFFNGPEEAIRYLFFEPSDNDLSSQCNIDPSALLVFALPYLVMMTVFYGIAVPSGLFVPSILAGSALGRLMAYPFGMFWHMMGCSVAKHGTYALIGACALLGGLTRMTISLTLIMIECTGSVELGLPIFLTALAARWAGQMVNKGIYDIHIALREVPFLDWEPPLWYHNILACEIMSPDPVSLRDTERAGRILDALHSNTHNGFPITKVIGRTRFGQPVRRLRGIMLRKHLAMLLSPEFRDRVLVSPRERGRADSKGPLRRQNVEPVTWDDLESAYPRFPDAKDYSLTDFERDSLVELGHYCDPVPHMVNANATVWHVYALFRQLGLRHLCVVDDDGDVVGIITRQDLTREHCEHYIARIDLNPNMATRMWTAFSRRDAGKPSADGSLRARHLSMAEFDRETMGRRASTRSQHLASRRGTVLGLSVSGSSVRSSMAGGSMSKNSMSKQSISK